MTNGGRDHTGIKFAIKPARDNAGYQMRAAHESREQPRASIRGYVSSLLRRQRKDSQKKGFPYPLKVGSPVGKEFFRDKGVKLRYMPVNKVDDVDDVPLPAKSVPLIAVWDEHIRKENSRAYRFRESIRNVTNTVDELYSDVSDYVHGIFQKRAEPLLGREKRAFGGNMLDWLPQAAIALVTIGILAPVAVRQYKESQKINSPAYKPEQAAQPESMYREVRESNQHRKHDNSNKFFYIPSDSAELADLTPKSYKQRLTLGNEHEETGLKAGMLPEKEKAAKLYDADRVLTVDFKQGDAGFSVAFLRELRKEGYGVMKGELWGKKDRKGETIKKGIFDQILDQPDMQGVDYSRMQPGQYKVDLDKFVMDGTIYNAESEKLVVINHENLGPNTVKLKEGYGIEKVLREYFDGCKLPKSILYGKDGKWGLVHATAKASGLPTDMESMKHIPVGADITIPQEAIDAIISGDTSDNFDKYIESKHAGCRASSIDEIGRRYASGESASHIAHDFADPQFTNLEYIRKTGIAYTKNNNVTRNRFDCRGLKTAMTEQGIDMDVPEYLAALNNELGREGAKNLLENVYGMSISDTHFRRLVRHENLAV